MDTTIVGLSIEQKPRSYASQNRRITVLILVSQCNYEKPSIVICAISVRETRMNAASMFKNSTIIG
jgi:hypothetical protein